MTAACDVVYLTIVAMETNKTPRGYALLKVQIKFVVCTKFHVNWMNCVQSRIVRLYLRVSIASL